MLSKQAILDKTNQGFDVFRYYISLKWQLGKNFLNPLYEDRKASCSIYFDRNTKIYKIKDLGNESYSGDCFSFIGNLKGLDCSNTLDFIEILKIIDRDLSLGLENQNNSLLSTQKVTPSLPEIKRYNLKQQNFTQKESFFWKQFGITEKILDQYKVVYLQKYESETNDGKFFTLTSSSSEPIFVM